MEVHESVIVAWPARTSPDAFANRLEKSVDDDGSGPNSAVVTRFALDGWNPVKSKPVGLENFDIWADLDGSSSLTTRYVRSDRIDELAARIDGGDTRWYLLDSQNSTRDVIDNAGGVLDSIQFDAWGNITAETDDAYRGRYAWTGREFDVT